ncbi:mechanosensitive ion channel domain-containing protein [Pseudomonadota bacterium]
MEQVVTIFAEWFSHFSFLDGVLLVVNGLLLLFSRSILERFTPAVGDGSRFSGRLHIFRAANLLVLLLVLFYNLFPPLADRFWITRLLSTVLIGYLGYLGFHVTNYLIKKRFGREREVNGAAVVSETYNSRVLSLITAVFLFIVCLIAIVRVLGFESLLEAGGVIGFVGVFLALTQGSWAPDIISGLVILNSRLFEEGDVIEVNDGGRVIGVVFKTKVFHTEVLNLVNNHRIMLQNSRLRALTIHNLSKFASARGLREELHFKIGYEVDEARVRELFMAASEEAVQDADILLEAQYPIEIRVQNAGDFAVEWTIYYYTKDVKHLLRTRQLFLAVILRHAAQRGVSLATPLRHQLEAQSEVDISPASLG